jgi:catechol 2,3-dioxygenase-like lactoylglutathione lyase family enzyme
MIQLLGFHHVAITVSDRDASAAWYANVLGFEEMFREESEDRRACVMRSPGGAWGVALGETVAARRDRLNVNRSTDTVVLPCLHDCAAERCSPA